MSMHLDMATAFHGKCGSQMSLALATKMSRLPSGLVLVVPINFPTIPVTPLQEFRRVTIQEAQPSPRLSGQLCFLEGFVRSLCGDLFEGSAGFCRGSTAFSEAFPGSDPSLVTLGTLGSSRSKASDIQTTLGYFGMAATTKPISRDIPCQGKSE